MLIMHYGNLNRLTRSNSTHDTIHPCRAPTRLSLKSNENKRAMKTPATIPRRFPFASIRVHSRFHPPATGFIHFHPPQNPRKYFCLS